MNSIIDVSEIKPESQEQYIKIMRKLNIEDWNIWLKEERDTTVTGLLCLKLLGGIFTELMEIGDIEKMIGEFFKIDGEVVQVGFDRFKFYLEGKLIYTVSGF